MLLLWILHLYEIMRGENTAQYSSAENRSSVLFNFFVKLKSICFSVSISIQDAYLPPHLYGRLASTPEGAEVLARDSSVLEAVQNVRRAEPGAELNQRYFKLSS